MKCRPERYQCPKCRWDFAFRKKKCCPGCGTLLLIGSDNVHGDELRKLKDFWMWDPLRESWYFISDFDEHSRKEMRKIEDTTRDPRVVIRVETPPGKPN